MVSQAEIYEVLAEHPGEWYNTSQLALLLNCCKRRIARQLRKLETLDDIELKHYTPSTRHIVDENTFLNQKMGFLIRLNANGGVKIVTKIN